MVSQKGWTLSENSNFKLNSALFASLLRTNIFAAMIDNRYYDTKTGEMKENGRYACLTLFPIETGSFISYAPLFFYVVKCKCSGY